jgi:hypothetical protein
MSIDYSDRAQMFALVREDIFAFNMIDDSLKNDGVFTGSVLKLLSASDDEYERREVLRAHNPMLSEERVQNWVEFQNRFAEVQQRTFTGIGPDRTHTQIVELPCSQMVGGGSFKQLKKAYGVNRERSDLLAQMQYRSEKDPERVKAETEHTEDLYKLFSEKGWDHKGVEIPFMYRTTSEGRVEEFSLLHTPIGPWVEENLPSQKMVRGLLLPVVCTLKSLHAYNIVHRDVKPDNIVINFADPQNLEGKLIDWGTWYKITLPERPRVTGTMGYMAPECTQEALANIALKAVDVFALGITFYQLLRPQMLQWHSNVYTSLIDIKPGCESECEPFARLIFDMTRPDPSKRPTMAQVAQRLKTIQ